MALKIYMTIRLLNFEFSKSCIFSPTLEEIISTKEIYIGKLIMETYPLICKPHGKNRAPKKGQDKLKKTKLVNIVAWC